MKKENIYIRKRKISIIHIEEIYELWKNILSRNNLYFSTIMTLRLSENLKREAEQL